MAQTDILRQVEKRVLQAIEGSTMWCPGEAVVVAVSGGPDSLCLLHVLHVLEPQHGGRLHVAHLDHRFRGAVAAAEAKRVAALARSWDLPATVEAEDVSALMERAGFSAEEAARRARYLFLARVAAELGAGSIALGHTADDQVETVLMHIVRGSGVGGLQGMRPLAPVAPWMAAELTLSRPLYLARPLLLVTRAETEAYCAAAGLSPVQDAWNQDPRFLRVRLRQEVIPLLETVNPRFGEALLRLAQLAAWQEADLQAMLQERWSALVIEADSVVRLKLEAWADLPWTLRLLAVRRAVEQVRGHLEELGWEAVVAAARLDSAAVGSEVALVEDVAARREYGALAVGRRADLDAATFPWPNLGLDEVLVEVPGRTALPDGHALVATQYPSEDTPFSQAGDPTKVGGSRWEAWVDGERCGRLLWLRRRRPGDRFQPLGMSGQKKLQDFFVDEKVPRAEREQVPLVISPGGIVWVVGYRLDERFRVRPETRDVIHLYWERPSRDHNSR